MNTVLGYIRKIALLDESRSLQDRELLCRFLKHRDEAAFAVLVDRHGPLIHSACRRLLSNPKDAEDVLQATFLVFAQKAGSIRRTQSVGSWLYGVAYRLASQVRLKAARQRAAERRAVTSRSPQNMDQITWGELRTILDEELQRLPEKYRAPIWLCCLEGKSRDEAARELGWSQGAVKIRLERGRALLRRRLAQRGLTLSAVLFGTLLGKDACAAVLPVRLVTNLVESSTRYAAGQSLVGLVPSSVIALADGMLRTLALARLKLALAVLLLVGAVGLGLGTLGHVAWGGKPQKVREHAARKLPPVAPTFPAVPETPTTQQPEPRPPPPEPIQPVKEKEEKPEGPSVVGTIRAVHGDGQTLTLRANERDTKYVVSPTTQVLIDGKEARFVDLRSRYRALLTLTPDEKEVIRVAATGPVLSCPVQSVASDRRTITVACKSDSRTVHRTFQVLEDAKISVLGTPARLTDLKEGMEVTLQFSVDEKTVRQITCSVR